MPDFNQYSDDYYQVLDGSLRGFGIGGAADFFARSKAWHLAQALPDFRGRILDWGCGHGLTAWHVGQRFPYAVVEGYDPAAKVISGISEELRQRVRFFSRFEEAEDHYDVVFAAGVVHHIPVAAREKALAEIRDVLSPGGRLFIFEHNATNPLARKIMDACPFDDDAVPVTPKAMRGTLQDAGFSDVSMRYISFVPPALKWLLPMERILGWCPLGLQYLMTAVAV